MRLPVNTVIHPTLVGLEPATFRSLVDCWSDALPVVPPRLTQWTDELTLSLIMWYSVRGEILTICHYWLNSVTGDRPAQQLTITQLILKLAHPWLQLLVQQALKPRSHFRLRFRIILCCHLQLRNTNMFVGKNSLIIAINEHFFLFSRKRISKIKNLSRDSMHIILLTMSIISFGYIYMYLS